MRRPPGRLLFHRVSAGVWAGLLLPALLWWPESVAFVIVASVYANVKSDWGAAEASDDRAIRRELELLRLEVRYLTIFRPHDPS